MAFGLECFNASGVRTLSLSSRLLRYVGAASVPSIAKGSYVDITFSGAAPDGSWAAWMTSLDAMAVVMTGVIRVYNVSWVGASTAGTLLVSRC